MSRILLYFFYITCCLCLSSCSSHSLEGYYDKGISLTNTLIQELEGIKSREDLINAGPHLKQIFLDLIKTSIAASEYVEKHPHAEPIELSQRDHARSERVKEQLQRIYHMEGCRELMEKYQQESLNLLDAFQQQQQRRKASSLRNS